MLLQEQQTNDTTIQEHECIDYQCPGVCPLCPFSTYEFSSTIDKNFRPFDVDGKLKIGNYEQNNV